MIGYQGESEYKDQVSRVSLTDSSFFIELATQPSIGTQVSCFYLRLILTYTLWLE